MTRRRERLDRLLVERGLAPTRTRAQALILAGRVSSGEQRLDKPGQSCSADLPLAVAAGPRWVGRGGEKLAAALQRLAADVAGRDALDVGASTGGFTDVLLAAGARRVVALDVGRGQLDWTLRNEARVTPLEGLNARYLRPEQLPFPPGVAVVDVSFISLELVLPAVVACLAPRGELLALVKPQFEVGRRRVGRGGIVRERSLHLDVLRRLTRFIGERGWGILGLCASAVRGARGNVEFFVHLRPAPGPLAGDALDRAIEAAVAEAHAEPPP